MRVLLDLYVSFLKIGAFTLGGGFAMIPLIQREAVDRRGWVAEDEMTDIVALGQSLPGVVGINTATAVGSKAAGFAGSLAATLGMITPSVAVITVIAVFFDAFMGLELVNRAFMGVRPVVAALIASAAARMVKSSVKGVAAGVICLAAFAFALIGVATPYIVLAVIALGLIWFFCSRRFSR